MPKRRERRTLGLTDREWMIIIIICIVVILLLVLLVVVAHI
jgi:t-SNARE complex subunit (syntaxin)